MAENKKWTIEKLEIKLLIVVKTRCTVPPAGITDMINQGWCSPVSQRTVKRRLYENNYQRVIVKKTRIRDDNRKKRMSLARGKRLWRVGGEWDRVIFTDECKVIIKESYRVYVQIGCQSIYVQVRQVK